MPYFSKSSTAVSIDEIRNELVELISNQLKHIDTQKELLLWINETNCYVSCLWYNSDKDESDESDNYSVVEFDELLDIDEEETDESFYELILSALKTLPKDSFKNQIDSKICIFETDEMNEPTKIFELENRSLKIIAPVKEDWTSHLIEEVENDEILTTEFKKKKLILWLIRTVIAIILYIIFWKYEWVKWSLLIYIPLNLFSLLSIFIWRKLINRKLKKIKNQH